MTTAAINGEIFITFFNVVTAERALVSMNGHAEYVAPAMHDFREVSVPISTFHRVADELGENPGVARCSMLQERCLIEFYDMRDAQHFVTSVPESSPWPSALDSTAPESKPQPCVLECPQWPDAMPSKIPDEEVTLGADPVGTHEPGGPLQQRSAPQRSFRRLRAEKYTKFDIDRHMIQKGKDIRTTVMIRNLPKWFQEDHVREFLVECGMAGRYNFIHMPRTKRSVKEDFSFAFVNFLLPQDILHLSLNAQGVMIQHYGYSAIKKPLGLSYARFQCHEKFMHNSLEPLDKIRLLMNSEANDEASHVQQCT